MQSLNPAQYTHQFLQYLVSSFIVEEFWNKQVCITFIIENYVLKLMLIDLENITNFG